MVATQKLRERLRYEAKQGMAYGHDLQKAVVMTMQ
jgi:hypothetical protein